MSFAGGIGTAQEPYLVATAVQLNDVRNYLTAYFKQTADIDLSDYSNFSAIGTKSIPFAGSYDGDNFKITGLSINKPTEPYQGLFGYIYSTDTANPPVLKNINIVDANIAAWSCSGILLGQGSTQIINCHTSGTITGRNDIGGIAGELYDNGAENICLTYSSSTATVTGTSGNIGGIVGYIFCKNISNCYHIGGKVTGSNTIGGFAGMMSGLDTSWKVENCYAYGELEATGAFSSKAYTGGFAGELYYHGVSNCYAACTIINSCSCEGCVGGFTGDYDPEDASVTACYYDSSISGLGDMSPAIGKTTEEMKAQETFIGWDFTSVWGIQEGYPYLQNSLDAPIAKIYYDRIVIGDTEVELLNRDNIGESIASWLKSQVKTIEQVLALQLSEAHVTDSNGYPQNNINVSFDTSNVNNYKNSQIHVSTDGGVAYAQVGVTNSSGYVITAVKTGVTYTIKVVACDTEGNIANFANAPTGTITITGSLRIPETPTQLLLTWDNEGPYWTWSHNANSYFDFYELRLDVSAGSYDASLLDRTRLQYSRANPGSRSGTAYLFARNIFGDYSIAATYAFSKNVESKPTTPTLEALWNGVRIDMSNIPATASGIHMHITIDGTTVEEFDISSNMFTYFRTTGVLAIKYCFIDALGYGEYSDTASIELSATLAEGSVTDSSIADGAVTEVKIAEGSITADKIATNAVTASKISANSIKSDKIAAGAITADKIFTGAITADKIQAGAITSDAIQAGSIIGEHIAAGAVTAESIAAGAITSDKIQVTSLDSLSATIGTLRTATTGARVEISDNLIKVYDTNNVLRVRLGVW